MKTYVTAVSFDSFELKYFKTTAQEEDDDESSESYIYGVFVEKHVDGGIAEEMDSGPVSESDAQICEIIDQLAAGGVTPFVLHEILDELEVLHK
jgi:hypothetical protein